MAGIDDDTKLHPFLEVPVRLVTWEIDTAINYISNAEMLRPTTFEEAMFARIGKLVKIMEQRQRKYGVNNIRAGGVIGLVVRMGDKMARLQQDLKDVTLVNQHDFTVKDIPVRSDEDPLDAWFDVGNYGGVIGSMLLEGEWGLPMMEDTLA